MLLSINIHLISSQNLPWTFIWDYDGGFLTLTQRSESRYVPLASWCADYLLLLVACCGKHIFCQGSSGLSAVCGLQHVGKFTVVTHTLHGGCMFLLKWYRSYTKSDRITVKKNIVPPVEIAQPTSVHLDKKLTTVLFQLSPFHHQQYIPNTIRFK